MSLAIMVLSHLTNYLSFGWSEKHKAIYIFSLQGQKTNYAQFLSQKSDKIFTFIV